jgi:DNA-binding transcriptional LysR family regulator
MQSAARTLLPDALSRLERTAPGVRLELKELTPEEGLVELVARSLDLVIAEQYPGHSREHRKGTRRTTLGRDRMRIALPPDDKVTKLVELAERSWVFLPPQMHAQPWVVQQCRAAGFEPDVKFEVADLATHIRLIASGHAVGILPDLLWADVEKPVRLLDLPGDADREIFLATRAASFSNRGIASVCIAFQESFAKYSSPAIAGKPDLA